MSDLNTYKVIKLKNTFFVSEHPDMSVSWAGEEDGYKMAYTVLRP